MNKLVLCIINVTIKELNNGIQKVLHGLCHKQVEQHGKLLFFGFERGRGVRIITADLQTLCTVRVAPRRIQIP